MTVVYTKKGVERKLKNGYPWIFKDEVSEVILGDSSIANVFSKSGEFLGRGTFSKDSRITVRMLTSSDEEIDRNFFKNRISEALRRREEIREKSFRVVHAEGDFLPGLVIDKYENGLVIQLRTKAMEDIVDEITKALEDLLEPSFIYERSDFGTSSDEKLARRNGPVKGETPGEIVIEENGLKFLVNVSYGQKTGFFFDQRKNRKMIRELRGKSALDLYTYTGGFALNLALSGAEVLGVDKSESDIEVARMNAKINGLNVDFVVSDVMNFLMGIDRKFDIVVADPPSLIKKKSEKRKAVSILTDLVRNIERVLNNNGIFVLCSCAYNIDVPILIESMRRGLEGSGKVWRILNITYQDVDHPYIAQIPETLYLKCVWSRIEKGW